MQHQPRPRMAVPQQHMAQGQHMAAHGQRMAAQGQHMAPARHMAPAQQQVAQASPQARKRLRMETLSVSDTGMMSLQRELMELKQENKRLRRDICKALPEVVHEMKDIVGQLQIFAKTLQSTCHQLNQTCQKMPQREALNRRMVTPANRTPPKQAPKLVRKVGPGQPPIRTVKTIETNSSQQRTVVTPNKLNNNQHYTSTSPASSPRFSPSAKQSPVQSPFSPNQGGRSSGSSPRQPRYPPSLPMEGASNNNSLPQVSSVTSLQSSPVPVQLNAGAAPPGQKQDVFELKPGSGVCIPIEAWLNLKVQNGDTETKMVSSLMKMLFTDEELRTQAMKATRPGQKCLDQSKIDAIIWRCMEEFPGKTKAHVVQAIQQKLQESRQNNMSSPDNDLLPEEVMMVLDPPTTVGGPKQNGNGSGSEGAENGKKNSDGDVVMVKEDPGWR